MSEEEIKFCKDEKKTAKEIWKLGKKSIEFSRGSVYSSLIEELEVKKGAILKYIDLLRNLENKLREKEEIIKEYEKKEQNVNIS